MTMRKLVLLRQRAEWDVADEYAYLAEKSRSAAERLLVTLRETLTRIGEYPRSNRIYEFPDGRPSDVRVVHMRGFRSYLVFYREAEDAVEVLRVIHGARDIRREDVLE